MTWFPKFVALALLAAVPFLELPDYYMHVLILILIWGFVYTGWSLMGRFGLVSLGHGAFLGIGGYTVVLLWNYYGVTPWLGIPVALVLAGIVALIVGYPCFQFRIVGHYFALVTLALAEVVRLLIIAMRDHTGGSLGLTPERYGDGMSVYAFQFVEKDYFYGIVLVSWIFGIWVWNRVEGSMARYSMEAISDDEDASAALGINVTWEKLKITLYSSALTAFGGALYGQYQMYVNPDTISGISVSLQIVFASIVGGMYVALGPTVGAVITILLTESLRVMVGVELAGLDGTIYGLMLILFIIFMPRGIVGTVWSRSAESLNVPKDSPS